MLRLSFEKGCIPGTMDFSLETSVDSYKSFTFVVMEKEDLMLRAIALSEESVENGGGPFGAVIARQGEIIAEASNSVTLDNDPTAHAEVNAIRKATKILGTFDLSGCDIYTSCEPCPMCLGAIYWAHLDTIYYANNRQDAARIGFDDDFIYQEIALKPEDRHKKMELLLPNEAKKAFEMWEKNTGKTEY
jgi:tRNA(Arg) A34 adenosine deaminase TadA